MSISFDQFRHAISDALAKLAAIPNPTPAQVAATVELQTILDGLPDETEDS